MKFVQGGVLFPKTEKGIEDERAYGVIVYEDESDLFFAKVSTTLPKLKEIGNDWHTELGGELIPPASIYPLFELDKHSIAPNPLPQASFVKVSKLVRYKESAQDPWNVLAELVRHDALACEVFKRNPHPNIAKFLGCRVQNDRITGLCFEKYQDLLCDIVDSYPEKLNKERCLEGIRKGIEHIHKHGFVHNDIAPHNIMFDSCGNAIVIDFDTCRPIGSPTAGKRTTGFFPNGTNTSEPENDYYALGKMEKYLEHKL